VRPREGAEEEASDSMVDGKGLEGLGDPSKPALHSAAKSWGLFSKGKTRCTGQRVTGHRPLYCGRTR
jgi:hypothetical protein